MPARIRCRKSCASVASRPSAARLDRGLDELRPRHAPEAAMRLLEAGDEPGHGDRAFADVVALRRVAEVDREVLELAERARRCGEEAVEQGHLPVDPAEEEAAAGRAGQRALGHGRRERGRDARVDGVSALLEDVRAGFGGVAASGGNRSLHETQGKEAVRMPITGETPDEKPATLEQDASRPRPGETPPRRFPRIGRSPDRACADSATARRPRRRGSRGPLGRVRRLALDRRHGVRRLDGDLGVRLAVRAHPLRRRDDAGGLLGALLHRLDRERARAGPARDGGPVRPLLPHAPQRGPALDGRRDRRLAERGAGDVARGRARAGVGGRRAPALADRGAAARGRGGGRNRVARP